MSLGYRVQASFNITQRDYNVGILYKCQDYFDGIGHIGTNNKAHNMMIWRVRKLSDLKNVIIPFLEMYPLQGLKYLDYQDFKQVINLMDSGSHLTFEGLERIRNIKSNMNRSRIRL